jgi:hypothetical protein
MLHVEITYHNQYGWNVIGSVDTGECEFPRIKIVVSNHKCHYSIAWDGRIPNMAEWFAIEAQVREYVDLHYPDYDGAITMAHCTM